MTPSCPCHGEYRNCAAGPAFETAAAGMVRILARGPVCGFAHAHAEVGDDYIVDTLLATIVKIAKKMFV